MEGKSKRHNCVTLTWSTLRIIEDLRSKSTIILHSAFCILHFLKGYNMTSKQRAYLKSLASNVDTIFQVGKGGIEENFIKQVDSALEAREIVKIKALDSYLEGPAVASVEIAQAVGAEVVQVIGTKFVLYRESRKNKKIILPK